jgi:hypothetical protein
MNYYVDPQYKRLYIYDGDASSATVFYTKIPDRLTSNTDEPEIDERYHPAIVNYVLFQITGNDRNYRNYLDKLRWARSRKNDFGPMTIRRYDY